MLLAHLHQCLIMVKVNILQLLIQFIVLGIQTSIILLHAFKVMTSLLRLLQLAQDFLVVLMTLFQLLRKIHNFLVLSVNFVSDSLLHRQPFLLFDS